MSVKDDDKPQLADSFKEAGGESSWKIKPDRSEMQDGSSMEQSKEMLRKAYPEWKIRSETHVWEEILKRLQERRKKMDKKTSKIPRYETDVLEKTLRLKGQKEKRNVWTDDESIWFRVNEAFQRMERAKMSTQFDDESNWFEVDRAFQNMEEASVSGDECISPDEMSDIVDEMDKLDVSEGDVTTEIRDVSSGIAISQTIDKVIPMEGELVQVGGCFVTFPPDSFDEPSDVKIKAEIDSSKWPSNFTGYTPTLYVTAKGLRKKLHLKLPSWRVTNGTKNAKAFVLHNWEYTDTTLPVPVNSEPYFEFDWGDFCPVAVGNTPMEAKSTARRMSGAVFVSEDAQVSVVFHINDQSSSDTKSSVIQGISEQMAVLMPPRHLTIRLTPFTAKENEVIQAHVSCKQPSELSFDPSDPFTFIIDEEFGETLEFNGSVLGELSEKQRIVLNCKVQRANGDQIGISSFNCNWRPTESHYLSKPKRKRRRKSKPSDFNVLIDNRRMVAQSIADRGAELANFQSSADVQIGVDSTLPDEAQDELSD